MLYLVRSGCAWRLLPHDLPWRTVYRVGCRLVMILLSQHGFSAAQIADLLGYDPCTVRRWIHRYRQHGSNGLADRPRTGRPRLGSHGSASASCGCSASPRPGPPVGSGSGSAGRP
jgi:hypothetical protein